MVDQEIRVLGDENIIANPKNSQKQYPLTFKAVPNVIVYGRKKADLNFTVPITEGTNFNFNLERTAIIFSDSFNLEEYSYIIVKNPFEEISDFFYVSSLEELDPTGKEFNEFNDEVVKWLRRLVNIISNRCMIFETTLFKDLNNFPNIKSGQTFIRTEDGWTGITIRDINSELDLIFNKYVEEINKKIQEHQTQMNELLEQWKQDIQKYAENVKQYEIVRVVTQTGHGFVFEPVMYSISQRKFVKAVFPHGADGVAVRVDDNNFRLVWAGRVEIPATAKDTQQRDFVLGEYYFLGEGSNGGIQREKPDTYYQHLFQVMYSDELRQNIADVLLSVPINQKGKRWDVGEAKTTVNDIEELKMSDFPVGKVVEVLGYYKAGDGADHKRIISTSDDGSGVQLNNGLWANIVHNGEVNVSWFGAKGDGVTDDTEIIKKVLEYNVKVSKSEKEFKITETLFDSECFIEDKIKTINKTIIYPKKYNINNPVRTLIGKCYYKDFLDKSYHQSIAYNSNKNEYIVGFSNEVSTTGKSVLLYIDKDFNVVKKAEADLGHCNGLAYNPSNNTLISSGYLGDTDNQFLTTILNYDTLEVIKTVRTNFAPTGITYDIDNKIYCIGNYTEYNIYDEEFKLLKHFSNEIDLSGFTGQDTEFFNGNYLIATCDLSECSVNKIFSNGIDNRKKIYTYPTYIRFSEIEGITKIDKDRILVTEYDPDKNIYFYILDFSKENNTFNNSLPEERVVYIDSNSKNKGDGSFVNPYKDLEQAILENRYYQSLTIYGKGIFEFKEEKRKIIEFLGKKLKIASLGGSLEIKVKETLIFKGIYLELDEVTFSKDYSLKDNSQEILNTVLCLADINNCNFIYKELDDTKHINVGVKFWNSISNLYNVSFTKCSKCLQSRKASVVSVTEIKQTNCGVVLHAENGIILKGERVATGNNPDYQWKGVIFTDGMILPQTSQVSQLNTPYHVEKMKQEGVYDDFIAYMDEKTLYDKQQRKLEQDRQLAYEEALKENPELTYEEFMSVQPMTLNLVEEPQPSDALKKFMEKYL